MDGVRKLAWGKKGITLVVLFSMLMILLVGCGPSRPKGANFNKALDTDSVVMMDKAVTAQLARQKEWVETKNGFLEAHVVLRNLGGRTLKIEIKTIFKDRYDAALTTGTQTWEPVVVDPHEDLHFHKLCPNKSGEGYQFQIRLAKNR